MKFDLRKPCDDCPFRRVGGVQLTRGRVREIARLVTSNPGATFACHKTTVDDDETGDRVETPESQHCAGALVFAHRQGRYPQLVRIAGRLGMYDPDALEGEAEIWGNTKEWLAHAIPPQRSARRGG